MARFQEIVPLNAGNVLGAEDSGPAAKWLSIIRQALNNQNSGPQVPDCYNGTADAEASKGRTCPLSFPTEDETSQEDFARFLSSSEEDSLSPPLYSVEQESHLQSDYTLVASKQMVGLLLCCVGLLRFASSYQQFKSIPCWKRHPGVPWQQGSQAYILKL